MPLSNAFNFLLLVNAKLGLFHLHEFVDVVLKYESSSWRKQFLVSGGRSKTATHKTNCRGSLRFFHLASDWLFPRNTITFQKKNSTSARGFWIRTVNEVKDTVALMEERKQEVTAL